jgi:hypothetical protein
MSGGNSNIMRVSEKRGASIVIKYLFGFLRDDAGLICLIVSIRASITITGHKNRRSAKTLLAQ